MMQVITPQKLSGAVQIPPSKSQAHRAVIAACLAGGCSYIQNLAFSEDIAATVNAMQIFGAKINRGENAVTVIGSKPEPPENALIDCCESGSTLRFLIPLAFIAGKPVRFTGRGRLPERPLDPYYEICKQDGIITRREGNELFFCGTLQGGTYRLPGNISSQFITGLLFALPLLKKDSVIELTTPLESAGYVDMTLGILSQYGICVKNENYKRFIVPGNQSYTPCDLTVEGDYSQAAFYLCANAMGSHVRVQGLNPDSCQGDKEIISIIERFGSPLKGTTIDVSQVPDLVPVLAVLASQAEGETRIINAGRLRIKESDRLQTVTEMLSALGAQITEGEDFLLIRGTHGLKGGCVNSHNDHRIAMAAAIAATVASNPVTICDSECVAKSYRNFWDDYHRLCGR
ncbi:MAG: 3-phosphoshikimate 1-carboxyvinyltransferase [Ruminococcaceae bacterium]|nr:3-phosphoshikimate 1-carboxyvinyltransferase [Oscillospiraceae bacterium]